MAHQNFFLKIFARALESSGFVFRTARDNSEIDWNAAWHLAWVGPMKWRAYGRNAILIEFAENPDEGAFEICRALVQALSEQPIPFLTEFVPGYTTILLEFALPEGQTLAELARASLEILEKHTTAPLPPGPLHRVAVRYDGPDLARVAEHHGLSEDQAIAIHSACIYRVHLLGFSPGFPYLGGLDPRLSTPRLPSPRPRVPAGSIAIGGDHTGIYSVDSPGGWNIIGRTDFRPFEPARAAGSEPEKAFALKAGDRVRFEPV